jgi:hypothetical protein
MRDHRWRHVHATATGGEIVCDRDKTSSRQRNNDNDYDDDDDDDDDDIINERGGRVYCTADNGRFTRAASGEESLRPSFGVHLLFATYTQHRHVRVERDRKFDLPQPRPDNDTTPFAPRKKIIRCVKANNNTRK